MTALMHTLMETWLHQEHFDLLPEDAGVDPQVPN